jgi:hypothetical protein
LLKDVDVEELTVRKLKIGDKTVTIDANSVTLPGLTADPTLAAGKMWFRSDLSRVRYSPDGTSVISIDPPLTAADVWSYSTRTLTQTKFPFWSAIITATSGGVSVPASSSVNVDIQPPSGEVWLFLGGALILTTVAGTYIIVNEFDGTTANRFREPYTSGSYGKTLPECDIVYIFTNARYCRITAYNAASVAASLDYSYSGFKLSQPLWSPKRLSNPNSKPWKKPATLSVPSVISPLQKYAYDILGIDPTKPDEYGLGIILEEDTPLAVDPTTNFPVERLTAVVKADVLADFIAKFKTGKADPVATGYSKYLKRWKTEGIDFGIPGI